MGSPSANTKGSASAVASETAPRTPAKEITNAHCHGGDGSRRRTRLISLGRKIAGKVQAKRAITIISVTSAVAIRISSSGNAFDFSNNSRIWKPVSRNSSPSIR